MKITKHALKRKVLAFFVFCVFNFGFVLFQFKNLDYVYRNYFSVQNSSEFIIPSKHRKVQNESLSWREDDELNLSEYDFNFSSNASLNNEDLDSVDYESSININFANISISSNTATHRNCTSPEKIPWIFNVCNSSSTYAGISQSTNKSCNLCSSKDSPTRYLHLLAVELEKRYKETCTEMVIYSVAFGDSFASDIAHFHQRVAKGIHAAHNKCLFMFTLPSQGKNTSNHSFTVSRDKIDNVIIIPPNFLPYQNMRRNTKIFKMLGHLLFPWTLRLVWKDAKLKMRVKFPLYLPHTFHGYFNQTIEKYDVCATYLGMPIHKFSLGSDKVPLRTQGFQRHCQILSLSKRIGLSDSQKYINAQCQYYNYYVNNTLKETPEVLSSAMVDSAVILRDLRSERCRTFNANLGCTWIDEIHCFSDRDQISFPFAMLQMKVHEYDVSADPLTKHRFFLNQENKQMVMLVRSGCHYYVNNRLAKCFPSISVKKNNCSIDFQTKPKTETEPKRVAILVSGTLQRYFFNSSLSHLIKPLSEQGHHVDYFLALCTVKAPLYRSSDIYTSHITSDPIFDGIFEKSNTATDNEQDDIDKNEEIKKLLKDKIEAMGGNLRHAILKQKFIIDDNDLVKAQRAKAKKLYPNEDPDLRFPVKDNRNTDTKKRTTNANRNLLSLHFAMQLLWENVVLTEEKDGKPYDYVIFLRDDAFWLADFDLNRLLSLEKSDIYILSCDARNPPMTPGEINDHAIISSRCSSELFGNYFDYLFKFQIHQCDPSIKAREKPHRSCNSEMILKWIIDQIGFSLSKVNQALIPFQRSIHVTLDSGETTQCFHKYCQSQIEKIDDLGHQSCKNLKFTK